MQVTEGNKTIDMKNQNTTRIDVHRTQSAETKMCVVNPIVRVEQVSEESNGNRNLNYMKSFSRTPSPAALSDSSSQDSSTNPPIYECLERLTEPTLYRSRLNTAISLNAEFSGFAVSPKPVRPRSEIFTKDRFCVIEGLDFTEKVQYASLMVELQQTFLSKKKMFQQSASPRSASESVAVGNSPEKTKSESKGSSCPESSQDDSQRTGHKESDAEFSKELEAALKLIQDLESPNTIETPSETCRSIEELEVLLPSAPVVCVQWENSECAPSVPEEVNSQGKKSESSSSGRLPPPSVPLQALLPSFPCSLLQEAARQSYKTSNKLLGFENPVTSHRLQIKTHLTLILLKTITTMVCTKE